MIQRYGERRFRLPSRTGLYVLHADHESEVAALRAEVERLTWDRKGAYEALSRAAKCHVAANVDGVDEILCRSDASEKARGWVREREDVLRQALGLVRICLDEVKDPGVLASELERLQALAIGGGK